MRTGFVPVLNSHNGGIYQYSQTMLHALRQWEFGDIENDLILLTRQPHSPDARRIDSDFVALQPSQQLSVGRKLVRSARQLVRKGIPRAALNQVRRRLYWRHTETVVDGETHEVDVIRYKPTIEQWIRSLEIDIMIYPAQDALAFESGIPYIMAVHDIQHRLQPEFPEVSANGEWERREYLLRHGTASAAAILVDSEVGKQDVLEFYGGYGVTAERVHVLPFLPATYLSPDVSQEERQRVQSAYSLPEEYIFYPAQFWPHKNHRRLVQALAILKRTYGLSIPMLFSGATDGALRQETFAEVVVVAQQLGISAEIHYLGYVPDEDMSALYAGASAMVMPTFFGPTNIPVLEAWCYDCPVITSDIRGIREQVGDAAILVDPRSPESIADGIYQVLNDTTLRQELARRGRDRLAGYTADDFSHRLRGAFDRAIECAGT